MKQQFAPYRPSTVPITNGQGKSLAQLGLTPGPAPCPRFKHQSFIYKERLYIHGGTTIPSSDFTDDALDLYSCELDQTGEVGWERAKTKCNTSSKELQALSGHAGVVSGNKYYSFGGSNMDGRPSNQLVRLNLDTLEWARLDQKGDVPTARQSAFLTFFEKNWLLLYGGLSTLEVQIYNTFHFYNLDTKNWSKCEGNYHNQVYARLDPAITQHRASLYLFGGTYRNMNNQEKYLDDFYEIAVCTPARNQAGKIQMKRLISPNMPESRSGHKLVPLAEEYLLLFGGENSGLYIREGMRNDDVHLVENIWIYSIKNNHWAQLQLQQQNFKFRTMASCDNYKDRIYIFGGIHNYNTVMGDVVQIKLELTELAGLQQIGNPCIRCKKKQEEPLPPLSFSTAIIEEITQNIEFPYAAVGLLIDNAMNNGASILKITYNQHSGPKRIKVLKFQDDAKLIWTEEELVQSMGNFHAGQMYVPTGIDKKIKAGILKDNMRRQYGYNLKIGSLRLGQAFLFVSFVDELMIYRIFVFQKYKKDRKDNYEKYVMHYYSYNAAQKKVTSPQMEQVRTKIVPKYGDFIDTVMYHRKCRNTLFIFRPYIQDTREVTQENEIELKADFQSSNILCGSYSKIKNLQKAGIHVGQCVDVSLRAYITCLYLKNQSMKITLSVKENSNFPIEIQTQTFLEKVDRLCKQKHVLEINQAFEFDLKIIEVYYLYDLKKKLAFFNNGLLIYHKNRLITRFKYPLGELIARKYYKHTENHNFIRLFGFIELPDHIPINIFKTSYTHHIMMEKLFSRLKFINKMFKKELVKIAKDPDYKRPAPTKLNQEEIMQDKLEAAEMKPTPPKERIKRTEPVQHEISLRKRKSPSHSSHKHNNMLEEKLNGHSDIPNIPENADNLNNHSNSNNPDNQENRDITNGRDLPINTDTLIDRDNPVDPDGQRQLKLRDFIMEIYQKYGKSTKHDPPNQQSKMQEELPHVNTD